MIFTGFKRKSNQIYFNKKIADFLKKSIVASSEKIKHILVLVDDISEKDSIHKNLMALFNFNENNIDLVVFQQKTNKNQILEGLISPKDFGWYGKIKSDKLKTILTKKYDLLINYSKVDDLYSNLLLLQCKAGFKAGFAHLDGRFYDLTIDCEASDLAVFNKELKKYLTILNKI
tara:strand:- start:23835 stop:24356 length:522 start_codon:yes stop_codon:yes gene_type:complete